MIPTMRYFLTYFGQSNNSRNQLKESLSTNTCLTIFDTLFFRIYTILLWAWCIQSIVIGYTIRTLWLHLYCYIQHVGSKGFQIRILTPKSLSIINFLQRNVITLLTVAFPETRINFLSSLCKKKTRNEKRKWKVMI